MPTGRCGPSHGGRAASRRWRHDGVGEIDGDVERFLAAVLEQRTEGEEVVRACVVVGRERAGLLPLDDEAVVDRVRAPGAEGDLCVGDPFDAGLPRHLDQVRFDNSAEVLFQDAGLSGFGEDAGEFLGLGAHCEKAVSLISDRIVRRSITVPSSWSPDLAMSSNAPPVAGRTLAFLPINSMAGPRKPSGEFMRFPNSSASPRCGSETAAPWARKMPLLAACLVETFAWTCRDRD